MTSGPATSTARVGTPGFSSLARGMGTMPPWLALSSSRRDKDSQVALALPLTLFSEEAAPPGPAGVIAGPTCRIRMDVAYVGTGYHGFATQPGQKTVGGALVAAIERN